MKTILESRNENPNLSLIAMSIPVSEVRMDLSENWEVSCRSLAGAIEIKLVLHLILLCHISQPNVGQPKGVEGHQPTAKSTEEKVLHSVAQGDMLVVDSVCWSPKQNSVASLFLKAVHMRTLVLLEFGFVRRLLDSCLALWLVVVFQLGGPLFGHLRANAQSIDDKLIPHPAKVQPMEIVPLLHDYDDAVQRAEKLDRPILVILGAEWCGPCKQLEEELGQPIAESIFQKWVVVKVDIDEEVALAKEWQVNAVPAFRILGLDQEVAASNEGYGGLKKLQAWLADNFDSANPSTLRLLRNDNPVDAKLVRELISMLRDRKPSKRKLITEKLAKNRMLAAGPLIEVLSAGNLSQKISALEILDKWSAPIAGLDPWEPDTMSSERLTILRDWINGLSQKPD